MEILTTDKLVEYVLKISSNKNAAQNAVHYEPNNIYSEINFIMITSNKFQSLFLGLLHCIIGNLNTFSEDTKIIYFERLIEKIKKNLHRNKNIDKNVLFDEINRNKNTHNILDFLSDYFCVNIFVLSDNTIFLYYNSPHFDIYRKNIIFKNNDDNYVVCSYHNEIIFNYNNNLILHLLNEPLFVINKNTICKLSYGDIPLDIYKLHVRKHKTKSNDNNIDCDNNEPEIITKEEPKKKPYSKKMTFPELQLIAIEYKIPLYHMVNGKEKQKTKQILIENIEKYLSTNTKPS